jgi:predicted ATP-grasp superfamily ATP-dependent carboligase
MARVLITDAEERSVLGACRGLERSGYLVAAVARTRLAASLWSRYCSERFVLPDPLVEHDFFVDRLVALVAAGRYAVLIPGSEASLIAASEHRDRLEPHVHLGLPDREVVERNLDKREILDAAAGADLQAPSTVICADASEAVTAARALGYPVVLKPNRSVLRLGPRLRQEGVSLARDDEAVVAEAPRLGPGFAVQRYQPSRCLFSLAGIFVGGRLLAATASRVWRTWPQEAGAHSFAETVRAPDDLVERIGAFLRELEWEGIFQVQLLELDDGRFSLIDFNPRPYASLGLDVRAGSNVAALWCDWVLGRRPRPVTARPGFRYRWEEAEVRHVVSRLRSRRLRELGDVVRPRRRVVHAHFELTDPGPLAARVLYLAARRMPSAVTRHTSYLTVAASPYVTSL